MPKKFFKRRRGGIKRLIRKMIDNYVHRSSEAKRCHTTLSATSISTVGTTTDLMNIPRGSESDQRNGDEVTVTGMYMRGVLTVADDTNVVRLLVYDPVDPDETVTPTITGDIDITRFKILYERTFALANGGPGAIPFTIKKSFRKLRGGGLQVSYDNASNVPYKHRFRIYAVSDSGAVTHPTITLNSVVYYRG